MSTLSETKSVDQRIRSEFLRLKKKYANMPKGSMDILAGLLDRAAYLRVSLDDMEIDMMQNGTVEPFSQSENMEPYERERPVVRQYTQLLAKYQSIIKQLDEKVPKADQLPKSDGFDEFAGL